MILVETVQDLRSKSLQDVKIKFNSSKIPTEAEFEHLTSVISVEQNNTSIFTLMVKGDVNSLLKILTQYNIERLTVEEATLEEIFLQYYQ